MHFQLLSVFDRKGGRNLNSEIIPSVFFIKRKLSVFLSIVIRSKYVSFCYNACSVSSDGIGIKENEVNMS